MTRPLVEAVLSRRRAVLALACGLALAALPGIARLRTDNAPAAYFQHHDPALRAYRAVRADFGSDVTVRIALRGAALWREESTRAIAGLEEAASRVAGVEAVIGPAGRHPEARGPALRDAALADPLDRELGLIDERGEAVTVFLVLDPGARQAALAPLERALAALPAGLDSELVGFPVLQRALDRSSQEIFAVFFPLLVVVSATLLGLAFRSKGAVAVPLLFVGLCELSLLGAMGWSGVRLNLVLAILPPLLFTVALATAIHVLTRTRALREAGLPPRAAVEAAYRDKSRALLWTAVSTTAGFGSLATSAVGPVRSLGLWAALGTTLLGVYAFVFLPALLLLVHDEGARAPRRPLEGLFQRVGSALAEGALRHRRGVYALLLAASVAAALGVPRLRVESNALRYLPADDPARHGIERLEAAGIGVAAAELVARAPHGETLASGEALQRLSWIAVRLREELASVHVVGPGDIVEAALRSSAEGREAFGSAEPREIALREMRNDPQGSKRLAGFLDPGGRAARLILFVPTVGYDQVDALLTAALGIAREEEPALTWQATGEYPLVLSAQKSLLATLGSSLGATLLSIVAILWLLLRSIRATALATIPNVFPVLLVLGAMGWLGVPVDIATVMVAATTLGLALDDTIHTLAHYRDPVSQGGGPNRVLAIVEQNAAAYSITGLVLGLGFAVCALSSFVPIFRFGTLSAGAIAIAVAADFLLVPALLGGNGRER